MGLLEGALELFQLGRGERGPYPALFPLLRQHRVVARVDFVRESGWNCGQTHKSLIRTGDLWVWPVGRGCGDGMEQLGAFNWRTLEWTKTEREEEVEEERTKDSQFSLIFNHWHWRALNSGHVAALDY